MLVKLFEFAAPTAALAFGACAQPEAPLVPPEPAPEAPPFPVTVVVSLTFFTSDGPRG